MADGYRAVYCRGCRSETWETCGCEAEKEARKERRSGAENFRDYVVTVDWLAQQIRIVNGSRKLGAGALAEKLVEKIRELPLLPEWDEPDEDEEG